MKKPQEDKPSRIPQFASREEEAHWFDTHDLADYEDEFKPVKVRFARNLSEGITIRFDTETLKGLRAIAKGKGMGPTTLVRMWILERLREEADRSQGKAS